MQRSLLSGTSMCDIWRTVAFLFCIFRFLHAAVSALACLCLLMLLYIAWLYAGLSVWLLVILFISAHCHTRLSCICLVLICNLQILHKHVVFSNPRPIANRCSLSLYISLDQWSSMCDHMFKKKKKKSGLLRVYWAKVWCWKRKICLRKTKSLKQAFAVAC